MWEAEQHQEHAGEDVENDSLHGWQFMAMHEHFDPYGSTVKWNFWKGLIVALVSLSRTIYRDHKSKHDQPPPAPVIDRTIRIELNTQGTPGQLTVQQRDQIIQAVVEETLRAIDSQAADIVPPALDR